MKWASAAGKRATLRGLKATTAGPRQRREGAKRSKGKSSFSNQERAVLCVLCVLGGEGRCRHAFLTAVRIPPRFPVAGCRFPKTRSPRHGESSTSAPRQTRPPRRTAKCCSASPFAAPNNTRPPRWAAKCCSASPFAVPFPGPCSRLCLYERVPYSTPSPWSPVPVPAVAFR